MDAFVLPDPAFHKIGAQSVEKTIIKEIEINYDDKY